MKLEVAQRIVEVAYDNCLEVTLRESYSGRSMYGKNTAALIGSQGDILKAVAQTAFEIGREDGNFDEFMGELDLNWDSMGRELVAY